MQKFHIQFLASDCSACFNNDVCLCVQLFELAERIPKYKSRFTVPDHERLTTGTRGNDTELAWFWFEVTIEDDSLSDLGQLVQCTWPWPLKASW